MDDSFHIMLLIHLHHLLQVMMTMKILRCYFIYVNMMRYFWIRCLKGHPVWDVKILWSSYWMVMKGHVMNCFELIKLDFFLLWYTSKEKRYLKEIREVLIEEAPIMFLIIVGHNVGLRVIADSFQQSLDTMDRHFINFQGNM